jgi:dihydroxy-acid dehydratase
MFTANSMNCLTEALGLSLPGNGTVVATHADREAAVQARRPPGVELCKRYYEQDDATVLPRSMGFKAFENAMTLDIAMGGSTNTILHLLAIAQEAEIDFTMADIDRLSRVVPQLCKVAPNTNKVPHRRRAPRRRHHGHSGRAGPRGQAAHRRAHRAQQDAEGRARPVGHHARNPSDAVKTFYMAGPAGIPTQVAFSQKHALAQPGHRPRRRLHPLVDHAFSQEGGLAVLVGNIALDGCVVKTAGVDDALLVFEGPAHVVESQDEAVANILADKVKAGDVVVVRYEGPKGGPGMQEMLYPPATSSPRAWARPARC